MTTWKLLNTGANIGAYNMALDEELLARAQAGDAMPVLRLYEWAPPAVSIGRFQKIETAVNQEACKRLGIDVVRRVTGGRAVFHHRELTYSIIARIDDPLFASDVLGTYKIIAACLVAGLANLGIQAETVARNSRHAALVNTTTRNPSCFSSPSWYEILVNNKKIIGSAQRRLSRAFLQHGSILLDHDATGESAVIPGACTVDAATSLKQELGRDVPPEEAGRAFTRAFAETLGIRFIS